MTAQSRNAKATPNKARQDRNRSAPLRLLPAVAPSLDNLPPHPRIKAVVRIDAVEETARVVVRGVVTHTNLRALYVLCRRSVTKLPTYEIVVDLARARVTAAAFDELQEHARRSCLSSGIDSSVTPCRLRIVEPPVILRLEEHA